jgi:hypothetical protein
MLAQLAVCLLLNTWVSQRKSKTVWAILVNVLWLDRLYSSLVAVFLVLQMSGVLWVEARSVMDWIDGHEMLLNAPLANELLYIVKTQVDCDKIPLAVILHAGRRAPEILRLA